MKFGLRFFRLLFGVLFAVVLSGATVGATFLNHWVSELPDYRELDQLQLEGTTKVYARNGRLLGQLTPTLGEGRIDRRPVKLEEISPNLVAAVVASEDADFFKHYGFDPQGIGRSLRDTLRGDAQTGASTITQQLVRNTILEKDRTIERKVKEIILAVQVERHFTKEEILQGYLNVAFWGGNLSGIRSAAQGYFGKSPTDLSIGESVYLASLLPNPRGRFLDYEKTRTVFMKDRLFKRMLGGRWITRQQADQAWLEKLQPKGWQVTYSAQGTATKATLVNRNATTVQELRTTDFAEHFLYEVRGILKKRFGSERMFSGGGLSVYTTLDPQVQEAAESAVQRARVPYQAQAAIAAIDPYTGEVWATAGGKRDSEGNVSEFNRATQSRTLQPGSSIKPLLYATLLESGYGQLSRWLDAPIQVFAPGTSTRGCPYNYWCPKNFDGPTRYTGGYVTARYALDHSLNLPTVRIGQQVTMKAFRNKLLQLGLTTLDDPLPISSVLGSIGASPLQMASAYATFVNGGLYREPSFITRIVDSEGRVLYPLESDEVKPRRVWSPQTAYVALDMICGVVNDPASISGQFALTARIAGRKVCGKTGTTNDVKAMWFVGVTPNLAASVWIGRDDAKPMPQGAYSGEYNPPVWRRFAENALQGKPAGEFTRPQNISESWYSGVRVARDTRDSSERGTGTQAAEAEVYVPEKPNRVEITELEPPPSGRVLVPLDKCNAPLRRADETTPPNCISMQYVRTVDLPFYDPNYQPPVYVPTQR